MLHGERDLQGDPQLMISGSYPARGALSACESTRVVIRRQRQVGGEGRLARGRRAPCVEPKRRTTTGVAASRRCTSLVDRRGRELGGGSKGSQHGMEAARSRAERRRTPSSSHRTLGNQRPINVDYLFGTCLAVASSSGSSVLPPALWPRVL